MTKDYERYLTLAKLSEKQLEAYNREHVSLSLIEQANKMLDTNPSESVKLYNKAGENIQAFMMLGICYENGLGVTVNKNFALDYFQRAFQKLYEESCSTAGVKKNNDCFIKHINEDKKTNIFVESSNSLQERKTYEGHISYKLGRIKFEEKKYAEAVSHFIDAARLNHPMAQYMLGICYKDSLGVINNNKKATEYLRAAADQGNVQAQTLLGNCYYFGYLGVINYAEAVKWYKKAAEQRTENSSEAQYMLGQCYEQGKGVCWDKEEAEKWVTLAAKAGYQKAVNQKKMTDRNGCKR